MEEGGYFIRPGVHANINTASVLTILMSKQTDKLHTFKEALKSIS